MRESSSYSMQALPKWYPLSSYRRQLVRQDRPAGIVNGDEIGLQMTVGRNTLLATSYDYFDGCHHWLYLLGEDGWPIDQLRMPDEFGFIQDVLAISENEVEFGYFGTNDKWNVVVSQQGFSSYRPAALLTRPNRFFLSKRYLLPRRTRGGPWSMPPAAPNE